MNLFRFIAERGDSSQLMHVENIDQAFDLKPLPPVALDSDEKMELMQLEPPLPLKAYKPR